MINFIVAVDRNNLIGKDSGLPWRLPEDLKYFKRSTLNHALVMGRKTLQSLPGILPGRKHFVLSRQGWTIRHPQVYSLSTIQEVLDISKSEDLFVIGGAEIFKQFMPYVHRMYITHIDEEFEGDTYFPEFDKREWELISSKKGLKDEKNPYDYYFRIYDRKNQ